MRQGQHPDTTEVSMGWFHVPSVPALAVLHAARSMIELPGKVVGPVT
jgi:hypothetical protein